MCGIAALYEPTGPSWLPDCVRQMTRAVRHRGPDGEGCVFFRRPDLAAQPVATDETPAGVSRESFVYCPRPEMRQPPGESVLALGHRRLAILDLSAAGHQPMSDAGGDVWITFNGEIYNYLELRTELTDAGHWFATGTDTEVLLAAWREWGENAFARCNGMFALVLFDRRVRRICAVRDRFGVKPLYFWRTPTGGMAFASEIKQFTVHPAWKARLNGQRAYDFINWGLTDHTAETLFEGVGQLRGGELLISELAALPTAAPRRWYDLQPAAFDGDFGSAARRFRELLDDSVRLRLRADVPVGSCLSGGLDSSSIVCTMRAQLGDRAAAMQKTFSAYSDVARFDERDFIEPVVAATGATAYSVVPDPDEMLAELDTLTWHQDEPFGSTSIWAQWCVFRLARANGVVVMLDGQGADEALGGYHGFFGPRLAGLLARGNLRQFLKESAAVRRLHGQNRWMQTRLLANELLPPVVADFLRRLIGRTVQAPAHLDLTRLGAEPRPPHASSGRLREPVRSLCHAQLTALSLPMLLHWEDRDSMAHGIEARVPFLDYRLVEFCLGLPEDYKLRDGWTKRVLREGMRGRLPENVRLRRDKLGFATAEEVWMRERRREVFLRLVDEAIDAAGGVLTPAARAKVTRILAGDEPFSFLVWRMIGFGRWMQQFDVRLPRQE
jgi:asparagine synthase (glutamine-hydrolysing)